MCFFCVAANRISRRPQSLARTRWRVQGTLDMKLKSQNRYGKNRVFTYTFHSLLQASESYAELALVSPLVFTRINSEWAETISALVCTTIRKTEQREIREEMWRKIKEFFQRARTPFPFQLLASIGFLLFRAFVMIMSGQQHHWSAHHSPLSL